MAFRLESSVRGHAFVTSEGADLPSRLRATEECLCLAEERRTYLCENQRRSHEGSNAHAMCYHFRTSLDGGTALHLKPGTRRSSKSRFPSESSVCT
ncbi:hypothetical protein KM043_002833 [Ampulex compressa]|nr:hypothetical protein KM043_002833 [Ampulex compressa]